jgi:hypothetical protein
MLKAILNWILTKAEFNLYTSTIPIGRRLGGFDDPNLPDTYICLTICLDGHQVFSGYFQKS